MGSGGWWGNKWKTRKNINADILNGDVEIEVTGIKTLNKAETPVFELEDTSGINEETRLKNRIPWFENKKMQDNIKIKT